MARVMTVLRQPAILWHDACKAESKAAFGGWLRFFGCFTQFLSSTPSTHFMQTAGNQELEN